LHTHRARSSSYGNLPSPVELKQSKEESQNVAVDMSPKMRDTRPVTQTKLMSPVSVRYVLKTEPKSQPFVPNFKWNKIPFEFLVDLCRRHLGSSNSFVFPEIPQKRLQNALNLFQIQEEEVAALYDDTLLGTAKDGFIFTTYGIFFRNMNSTVQYALWENIKHPIEVSKKGLTFTERNSKQNEEKTVELELYCGSKELRSDWCI